MRFRVPIGAYCKTNVHLAEKALLESAGDYFNVLLSPPPSVLLLEFGNFPLHLELRILD